MLGTYELKKQYQQLRQELSHSLYQYDAACRVIARLVQERDLAREALANVKPGDVAVAAPAASAGPADVEMEMDEAPTGISQGTLAHIESIREELSAARRKRKTPDDWTTPEAVKGFKEQSKIANAHNAKPPGITSLDIDSTGSQVLTGGNDKNAQIHDATSGKKVADFKGHTKKITSVAFLESQGKDAMVLTASADSTVKMWSAEGGKNSMVQVFDGHTADVTGMSLHPSKRYMLTASSDSTWCFHDINLGKNLQKSVVAESLYSSIQVHPDGTLFATGSEDGVIRVWDIRTGAQAATLSEKLHTGRVGSLSFSENGYMLASSSESNVVPIWDLRHGKSSTTLKAGDDAKVLSVSWDHSGQYLAMAGTDVRVYHYLKKTWTHLSTFEDNMAEITAVKFSNKASHLIAAGLDRTIRIYG